MVAVCTRSGRDCLVRVDLESYDWTELDTGLVEMDPPFLEPLSPTSFLVVGKTSASLFALYCVQLDVDLRPTMTMLHEQTIPRAILDHPSFSSDIFSTPAAFRFTSTRPPIRDVHGFFWPPHNPRFQAPDDELPPLIVNCHGGPMAHKSPGLDLWIQFWTSRGFAVFELNYAGSTGYGRAHRDAILGRWGLSDLADVPECVAHLTKARGSAPPLADDRRVGLLGASAGGYLVMQSLVRFPFLVACGVAFCGVADMKAFVFSGREGPNPHISRRLFPRGGEHMSLEEKVFICQERSPVIFAWNASAPLLLVHGARDTQVPVYQSLIMWEAMQNAGRTVELRVFEEDYHSLSIDSLRRALLRAERWWKRYLLNARERQMPSPSGILTLWP